MQSVDTIIHCRWLIPLHNNHQILDNQAVVITGSVIQAILPSSDVATQYRADEEIHCRDHAVMPGLVNAHTHIPMNLLRGLADDLALMDWLQNHIWPTEGKWLSNKFVNDASLLAMAEMIKGGITCFNDMYFFSGVIAQVAQQVGMRANIGIQAIDVKTAWAENAEECLAKDLAVYEEYKEAELINFTLAPHAIYTVTEKMFKRIKTLADELQLPIHMHVQETADEIEQSVAATDLRPLQRLDNLGLVSQQLLAVHLTQINEAEIKLLATNKANVVHCPESNMKLASGYCPVKKLIDAGINVALGTDGVASNNDLDMFGEMRSASLLAKLMDNNPESLPAWQVLQMATLNGAKALRQDNVIGSLAPGKAADLIAIDLNRLETLPIYNPISQIVYAASREQVTDVWVAGKRLLQDSKLTTIDEAAIVERAKVWNEKIMSPVVPAKAGFQD